MLETREKKTFQFYGKKNFSILWCYEEAYKVKYEDQFFFVTAYIIRMPIVPMLGRLKQKNYNYKIAGGDYLKKYIELFSDFQTPVSSHIWVGRNI